LAPPQGVKEKASTARARRKGHGAQKNRSVPTMEGVHHSTARTIRSKQRTVRMKSCDDMPPNATATNLVGHSSEMHDCQEGSLQKLMNSLAQLDIERASP